MTLQQKQHNATVLCQCVSTRSKFWQPVLEYLENENHRVPAELGVDMGIVAQVCQYASLREITRLGSAAARWSGDTEMRVTLATLGPIPPTAA